MRSFKLPKRADNRAQRAGGAVTKAVELNELVVQSPKQSKCLVFDEGAV